MASFSQRKVSDYSVAFLKLTHGKETIEAKELGKFLCSIGYCSDRRQARGAAQDLIERYDYSCTGMLCFEDFLLAMEEVEMHTVELRKYLEETLRYFCVRKLEQNSETPFGLDDIATFLIGLGPSDAQAIMHDIEKDVVALFSGGDTNKEETLMASFKEFPNHTPLPSLPSNKDLYGKPSSPPSTGSPPGKLRKRLSIFAADPRRMLSSNKLGVSSMQLTNQLPSDGRSRNQMAMALVSDNMITVPENSLIDIIVERFCPRPKELILYETIQGHKSQQLHIHSLAVRNLDNFKKTKLRIAESRLEYNIVDPMFVVSCGDFTAHTRPIRDYNWREEINESIAIELSMPSMRSDDIAAWIDETELMISVFDYCDGGITAWTEWVGTARRRLSWFLEHSREGAPVFCSIELTSITPTAKHQLPPSVEFSITIPKALIQLWHTYCERNVHPKANLVADGIRTSLESAGLEVHDLICLEDPEGHEKTFDAYQYWKKKRTKFQTRFPRRKFTTLAMDEYGKFHLLPCFVQPFPSIGATADMSHVALAIAALDSGSFPHCDTSKSAYQFETIVSPSLCFFSRKVSTLEAAILLCSSFLGLGMESYVCFCEMETPWVITVHPNTSAPKPVEIENQEKQDEIGQPQKDQPPKLDRPFSGLLIPQKPTGSQTRISTSELFTVRSSLMFKRKLKERMEKVQFKRQREKEMVEMDRSRIFIRLWNPVKGTWHNEEDAQAPRKVTTIFNHKNLWHNVHKSELITRVTWSTIDGKYADKRKWEPLLNKQAIQGLGGVYKVYTAPDLTCYPSLASRHKVLESKILLSDLVDAISLYRQHKLYLPDTLFDATLSQILQSELFRMKSQIEQSDNLSEPDAAAKSRTLEPGNHLGVPRSLLKILPPGVLWNGSIFSFKTVNVQEIMLKLEEVGILNHTFPGVRYTVAAAVFPYEWGLSQVWVYIGTVHEIAPSY